MLAASKFEVTRDVILWASVSIAVSLGSPRKILSLIHLCMMLAVKGRRFKFNPSWSRRGVFFLVHRALVRLI